MSREYSSGAAQKFFMPLTARADGILERVNRVDVSDNDLPPVEELESYIIQNFIEEERFIEISGKIYSARVFRPNLLNDYWYTIVDGYFVPIDANTADLPVTDEYRSLLSESHTNIHYSESLSPSESISIRDAFIEPDLEEIDDRGRHVRRLTWNALLRMPRVVVVGAPGAGKTTLLRRLAWEQIESLRDGGEGSYPVYLQLRHLREGIYEQDIYRRIISCQENRNDCETHKALTRASISLILDGLDEISQEIRESMYESIAEYAQSNRLVSIVASTRESGYEWQIPTFKYVRILPFSNNKIREWSYYRLKPSSLDSWKNFICSLEASHELHNISGNPLMLSLAVSLYRRNSTLPQSRSALLKSFFDAVTEQWDSIRGVVRQRDAEASPARKVASLARTAFFLKIARSNSFTETEFSKWNKQLSVDVSLLYICQRDTGLLKKDESNEKWHFLHKTFEDYLAARYVVEHTSDSLQAVKSISRSDDWIDVWAYSCGIAQDASDLLEGLLRNRRIKQIDKITAICLALEQDIIASESVRDRCFRFVTEEMDRVLFNNGNKTAKVSNDTGAAVAIYARRKTGNNALKFIEALMRLRGSMISKRIIAWLLQNRDPLGQILAEALESAGSLSITSAEHPNEYKIEISIHNVYDKYT